MYKICNKCELKVRKWWHQSPASLEYCLIILSRNSHIQQSHALSFNIHTTNHLMLNFFLNVYIIKVISIYEQINYSIFLKKGTINWIASFWVLGRLPEIYTVRHGVTLKNKLFRILIFVKENFTAFFYSTSWC